MASRNFDLVITGGTVVDGSGGERRDADVGVRAGVITAVEPTGSLANASTGEQIDAKGHIVTPGFVDIHTHYDGQVTWDPYLSPSCYHGVTTVVMGNCGVGFAPVRPDKREWLCELMEGVEDIPGAALKAGMRWGWESFPEYIDFLASQPRAIDVGAQVGHGPVRAYVMGERGARNEPATADDIGKMRAIVHDAMLGGALGFSTSRTVFHKALDGEPVPGTFASEEELIGIAAALRDLGRGVFEVSPSGVAGENDEAFPQELDLLHRVGKAIGRPVAFNLTQSASAPDLYKTLLAKAAAARADGVELIPVIAGRSSGLLFGLETTFHPFASRPTWAKLAALAPAARLAELRKPEVRGAILSESDDPARPSILARAADRIWLMDDTLDYEPEPRDSVGALARARGLTPAEVLYDMIAAGDGTEIFNVPMLNYAKGDSDAVLEMITHPCTALGLSDGGAHVAIICDASIPTSMITHWTRDRTRGERLPLEYVVHRQSRHTASIYGMNDRGLVQPGYKADLNVFDYDKLSVCKPYVAYDLPGGARRLMQKSVGYKATVLAGQVTVRDGELTGAMPGTVVRS